MRGGDEPPMNPSSVQLIFRGEVLAGFQPADVRRSLGDQLKLDDARLAHLFSGQRVVLKRSIAADAGRRHVAQFAVLGARLHLEAAADAMPPPPTAQSTAPRTAADLAQPATVLVPRPPPSMALVPGPEVLAAGDGSIVCPKCGERQPQAVFCIHCTTNMPMGITAKLDDEAKARAGKDAQRQAEREARLTRHARRGARPPADDTGAAPFWGLGLRGRMSRRPYAAAGAGATALLTLVMLFVLQRPGGARFALAGLVLLAVLAVSVRWTVLRCHDFNRSGWWSLLLVVPYLGPFAGIAVSLIPGSAEANEHGPAPDPGSWLPPLLAGGALALVLSLGGRSALNAYERELDKPDAGAPAAGASHSSDHALTGAAAAAFDDEYTPAAGHKAFARSSGGGWGWKAGMASPADAVKAAVAACEAARQSYAPACEAVDIDGQSLE